jgi:AraC-like DNA-binding protein
MDPMSETTSSGSESDLPGLPCRARASETRDSARFFRSQALPGVEILHARFITHRYAPHLHHAWTIAAVDSGVAAFDLEGAHHIAPAGAIFLIPPYAVHTGEPAAPLGYRYRVAYLDPSASLGGFPDPLATRPRHALPVVVRDGQLLADLSRLHSSIVLPGRSLEQGETLATVSREVADLVRDYRGRELGPVHVGVARAVSYIHAYWRDDFTLADLADASEVSPFHLIRIFRQHVGVTPSAYRRALRIRTAQSLLRVGRPPAEAAAECGFCDQSHLNRHFKSVTGVTPRQYLLAGT